MTPAPTDLDLAPNPRPPDPYPTSQVMLHARLVFLRAENLAEKKRWVTGLNVLADGGPAGWKRRRPPR